MALIFGKADARNGLLKRMARRPRGHEKIFMDKKRFGYFPQQFIWRGRRYEVYAVERCWTVSRRRFRRESDRRCFRVHCADLNGAVYRGSSRPVAREATFDLFQDLGTGRWYLERVVTGD
jgi:hypothetical protein